MTEFRYTFVGPDGAVAVGTVAAADRPSALRALAQRGVAALELQALGSGRAARASSAASPARSATAQRTTTVQRPTIKRAELANLVREIATATEAGLPLLQALQTVRRQAAGRAMPVILDFVIERVEAGRPLHQAASDYGPPFDEMTVGMLRAADTTGRMAEVLHQLADLLERQVELRREVQGAVVYPAIVACLIAASIAVLVVFVLPRILDSIVGQVNLELPLPTRILLGISDFVVTWWWLLGAGVIAGIYAWKGWIIQPQNRLAFDRSMLRLPVVGRLARDVAVARFTRTLGTLVSAGIPILQALKVVRDTLGNRAMMAAIDEVTDRVSSGASIADPMERSGLFPPLLVQIVNIGEKSGRLEAMLMHAAGAFDRQVNASLKVFTSILPPLLIVVMAVVASFVLAGMLLPILQMQEAISG